MMYKVECRYEYLKYLGKRWTSWFASLKGEFLTEKEAEVAMKELEQTASPIDKITKLKHEFRIVEI